MPIASNSNASIVDAELFYVLLLFSGFIKRYLIFLGLDSSVDFTLVVGVILIAFLCFSFLQQEVRQTVPIAQALALGLMFLFVVSVLVSMLYTRSSQYYLIKLVNLGVCVLAYAFPLLMRGFDYRNFFKKFVNTSLLFSIVFFLIFPMSYKIVGLEGLQATYLVVGYLCGLNILILLTVHRRNSILILLFFVILVISGARGALLFTGVSCLFILILSLYKQPLIIKPKSILLVGCTVGLVVLFVIYSESSQEMLTRTINRTMVLFGGNGDVGSSAQIRIDHIKKSIMYISDEPVFGYGLGSYSFVTTGLDLRAYPHNSVLEVWFELGALGLLCFLAIIVFHVVWSSINVSAAVGVVVLYLFLGSLVSSSFAELKLMYGLCSVFMLATGYELVKE